MIGTKLAHYEITSHIGSGGMGDVYQANDTKLGRSVAIKFLPEAFSHDSERVARFQREARILASLNHANIAGIHGLEERDGRHFLVMELVSGETLADRIKRGAIPIEEALPIAKQICDALEAAHEKGIIHRDLKPANIKVTPDGKVKVLDFGLAKAFEGEPANSNLSNSPTLSLAATNAGVILGTAAYMSPEQAKGKTVDRRADIWAFGVVMYEMLTGRLPFSAETTSEMMAAVMTREPDWNAVAGTPLRIRELLRRCLVKDPHRRLRDIGEARITIEEQSEGTEMDDRAAPTESRRLERVVWISALMIVSVIAVVLGIGWFRPVSDAPEMRTEVVVPASTIPGSFVLSPDGHQLVFVASGDGPSRLWVRPLVGKAAVPLAGTEGAAYPFWSPDSRSVGFFADSKLKRVDIAGGSPQTLATAVLGQGGTWNAEGVIVFTPGTGSPLFRISATGGDVAAITKLDRQYAHGFPQFLPSGREFLFYVTGTPETAGIYLGSLDSREIKRLAAADSAGVYAPPGWVLWARAGVLVAQRLDLGRRELAGEPMTVADAVGAGGIGPGAFSVSAAGLIAYRAASVSRRQLRWFDRTGAMLGTLGASDETTLRNIRISPDGRRVAVTRTIQSNADIWLVDATRTSRFTFDPASDQFPVWSPDGSRIVFESNRKKTFDLYMKPASGAGAEELLLESPLPKFPEDWSTDGRFILYTSLDPQTVRDLWILPLEEDRKPWLFLKTNFDEAQGQFSPDGRWVAYQSNESGRYEIYVRPFMPTVTAGYEASSARGQWQVSTAGGILARWRRDSKELYYVAPDGRMMAAPVTATATTLEPGMPVPLFNARIPGGGTYTAGWQYDVSRDGHFLINTELDDDSTPITLIQNWRPEPGK